MTAKLKDMTKIFTSIFPVWSLWYIGILLIVYIISNIFSTDGMASFFGFGMTANRTYLLVLAIITTLMFTEWAVNMGVSRKTFYKSMMITGLVTAVFVTAVVAVISFGLSFTPFRGDYLLVEDLRYLTNFEYVIFHFLSGLLFWAAGVLIAASFYRGFWRGMLSVLAGITAIMLLLFNEDLLNYFGAIGNMTVYLGFALMLLLIVIYNWIAYAVVKNIPVKFG
ncbi:hypothetical protein GCM10007275_19040 [Jeotgalicoccus coquinae]|uniref:Uncharacterized protein n=1 Tax=Jeotgalicoccus coquinae TaxID=709509 RepID=A0A6V7RRU4_9STAP|nr:hypothetical protein [Jeotgalicoccus coquinae]MBB6423895.1 hypothetical protein [Jeotgalicoccus coquinae]GGE24152.1 hypothetical protein GCM10007275_19040 [Jeotgalicoccus coquinae]CAD2080560.1 hypothetical protein JEOCOQ751_01771 [Jeotgalicoccus coquinae]